MSKDFGDKVSKLLHNQSTTQKALAERIGITEPMLSRYISGDREPRPETIANIATALRTTSDYLLGIEEDGFDYPRVRRILARNSANMTQQEKKALIDALFGEE